MDNGFHYLSANYRLVNQLYLYESAGGEELEEEYAPSSLSWHWPCPA